MVFSCFHIRESLCHFGLRFCFGVVRRRSQTVVCSIGCDSIPWFQWLQWWQFQIQEGNCWRSNLLSGIGWDRIVCRNIWNPRSGLRTASLWVQKRSFDEIYTPKRFSERFVHKRFVIDDCIGIVTRKWNRDLDSLENQCAHEIGHRFPATYLWCCNELLCDRNNSAELGVSTGNVNRIFIWEEGVSRSGQILSKHLYVWRNPFFYRTMC
jgi:hypothetical protein